MSKRSVPNIKTEQTNWLWIHTMKPILWKVHTLMAFFPLLDSRVAFSISPMTDITLHWKLKPSWNLKIVFQKRFIETKLNKKSIAKQQKQKIPFDEGYTPCAESIYCWHSSNFLIPEGPSPSLPPWGLPVPENKNPVTIQKDDFEKH